MMLIETQGSTEWLEWLKACYNLERTVLRDSENSFTILMELTPDNLIWVARYCRVSGVGFIRDRRKAIRK